MTMDAKALSYILNHSYDFPKPEEVRKNLAELLGEGKYLKHLRIIHFLPDINRSSLCRRSV